MRLSAQSLILGLLFALGSVAVPVVSRANANSPDDRVRANVGQVHSTRGTLPSPSDVGSSGSADPAISSSANPDAVARASGGSAGGEGGPFFIRTDLDQNGTFTIADSILLLGIIYGGQPGPPCLDTADVNADGALTLSDVIRNMTFLFGSGPPPVPPYPGCGTAPPGTPSVGCAASNSNCL